MLHLTLLSALALGSSAAHAQIDDNSLGQIVQDDRVVGLIYVGLPPGPCRSVEQWFLFEDYVYPGDGGRGFTVSPGGDVDVPFERWLETQRAAHPDGTLVTVEIEEISAACR